MKHRIVIPAVIVLLIIMLLLLLPLPSHFNKSMKGRWVFSENQESRFIDIALNGQLNRHLVRRDYFNGSIKIMGFAPLDASRHLEVKLNHLGRTFYGSVFAYDELENRFVVYGTLYFDKDLSYVILDVSDAFGNGYICAPADSDIEARVLINKIPNDVY